jgi:hypothetical protein
LYRFRNLFPEFPQSLVFAKKKNWRPLPHCSLFSTTLRSTSVFYWSLSSRHQQKC